MRAKSQLTRTVIAVRLLQLQFSNLTAITVRVILVASDNVWERLYFETTLWNWSTSAVSKWSAVSPSIKKFDLQKKQISNFCWLNKASAKRASSSEASIHIQKTRDYIEINSKYMQRKDVKTTHTRIFKFKPKF